MAIDHRRFVAEYDASILPYMQGMEKMSAAHRRWRQESVGGFKDVDNHATKTIGTMRTLLLATTALGGGAVLLAMTRYTDTAKQMDNQLRAIGATTEALQKQVFNLAINTRSPIESTVGLLRNMQKSLKDQDLERTIRQVGTLNRLLTIGGLDQAARGSVALQFGQALQSGVLAGDELRALREAAPIELLEAIAKAAGGTVESLRKLGSEGKLTRDVMVQALDDLEATSKEKFGNFKMTMAEASEAVRTALVATAGHFDKGLGVTSRIAQAEQALASFMMENAESAETLGRAFRMVLDAALVLAGSRGLLLLGSRFMAVRAEITALGVAMRGINDPLALFGGPWGLALVAAGTAFMALNRQVKTFSETLDEIDQSLGAVESIPDKYNTIVDEITADLARLEEAEKKVAEAIATQGEAAQAAAAIEKQAIEERIAKNRELLNSMIALATANVQDAENDLTAAQEKFGAKYGREGEGRQLFWAMMSGSPIVAAQGAQNIKDGEGAQIDALEKEIDRRIKAGERLTEKQIEFVRDREALAERERKVAEQRAKIAMLERAAREDAVEGETGDAAVAEQASRRLLTERQRQAEADAKLLEAYDKNTARLEELRKQREQAATALQKAVIDGDEATASRWLNALEEIDAKIEATEKKMSDPAERVNTMLAEVRKLRELVEAMPVDQSGQVRDALREMESRLLAAKASGEDLDAVRLGRLKGQFEGLVSIIDTLLQRMGLVGKTAAEIDAAARPGYDFMRRYEAANPGSTDRGAWARSAQEAAQRGILDLIGYAEGTDKGRGYNETLDYGRWTGGDRDLVNMTLKEILALGDSMRTPENRAMYGDGKGSSALGRYQIVGSTLRDLMAELGLKGDELFSPEMQDRLAMQLVRRRRGQGAEGFRNEWQGLNNVGDGAIQTALGAQVIPRQDREVARTLEEEIEARKKALEVRERFIQSGTEEAERRQFEIELMGKTASEQAYLTTKFELMNRAKRDGIDLDEQIAGSTRTYREEIEALAKAAEADIRSQERRAKAIENAEQKTEFLNQVNRELKDGILDAILEADNFSDALGNVARMLARAALEAALFGDGPLARSDNSGGLFGSLLDGLGAFFQNRFAVGGIMTSSGPLDLPVRMYSAGGIANTAQMAIFGEGSTPEAYVPLPDGRSIPVTLRMPDLDRLAAVGGSTAAPVGLSVNIYENAAEEAHEVSYSPQEGRLDIFLKRTVSDMIDSGAMDKSMSNRFGLRPSAKGR